MAPDRKSYVNVDQLIEQTPLEAVLNHYGKPLPKPGSSEHRMPCVFGEQCNESSYGQLAVNQVDAAKLIYCHSCGVRGNLLTLIHGLETGKPPAGGRVKGQDFKAAVAKLKEIQVIAPSSSSNSPTPTIAAAQPTTPVVNSPLKDNPKTFGLADLYRDFVSDPSEMSPNAASYFRKRNSWLTPEVAAKWRMGYIPRNGRSLFKGWIAYAHHNVDGEVISFSGRNPAFEEKQEAWVRAGRPTDKRPMKHRFVKGYERGIELYGQMAERLNEKQIVESLSQRGLVVVEGANDVIRLDCLGVAAVGLCSNQATDEQIEKIKLFASSHAKEKVLLMPDNDEKGQAGFRELAWKLLEEGLHVHLAWSQRTHDGAYDGLEPEDVTLEQWYALDIVDRQSKPQKTHLR